MFHDMDRNYRSDQRVKAGEQGKWYTRIDQSRDRAWVEIDDPDDAEQLGLSKNELGLWVQIKWEVCGTCNGRGSHVNPSIDSNGISAEEFAEDPDFQDDYLAGN